LDDTFSLCRAGGLGLADIRIKALRRRNWLQKKLGLLQRAFSKNILRLVEMEAGFTHSTTISNRKNILYDDKKRNRYL
jgi:hypothetical protein